MPHPVILLSAWSCYGSGRFWLCLLLAGILLWGAACAPATGADATPMTMTPIDVPFSPELVVDAEQGQQLYQRRVLGEEGAPGCVTCHSLAPDIILVGPSHYNLAVSAVGAVPGQDAAQYLWESITLPDAHLTEGYELGQMYGEYARQLTAPEIGALVAYLLTLQG